MGARKFDDETELLICLRYEAGESTVELGAAMGVGNCTIGNILKRRGAAVRNAVSAAAAKRKFDDETELLICSRYLDGENTYQLGAAMGVSQPTIGNILKRRGIVMRNAVSAAAKRKFDDETELLICSRYLDGENTYQLGAAMGVGRCYICSILKRRGIVMRSNSEAKGGLALQQEDEVIARYVAGENTVELGAAMGVSDCTIGKILKRNGIERRRGGGCGDTVQHALDCTGHHNHVRDCSFYIYELSRYSDTHCKPGISVDVENRAAVSQGEYGDEHFRVAFSTRQEAYFLEQALLDATRGAAGCPDDLIDWTGASEVRAMPAADLVPVAERLIAELDELGVWDFAALRVPMTMAQRAICQQRALQGAPIVAAAAVEVA